MSRKASPEDCLFDLPTGVNIANTCVNHEKILPTDVIFCVDLPTELFSRELYIHNYPIVGTVLNLYPPQRHKFPFKSSLTISILIFQNGPLCSRYFFGFGGCIHESLLSMVIHVDYCSFL